MVRVVLEIAPKRTFASALDWPGWARGGRTEEQALESLLAYAPRYAAVAGRARITLPAAASADVVERLEGNATTEFGVPGLAAEAESESISGGELERLVSLLRAAWATLDAAATRATGVELAKGPRGGGRDLDRMLVHVHDAEVSYLNRLGCRAPVSADETPDAQMALLRRAFVDALSAIAFGKPVTDPSNTRTTWPARYAVRRAAWHVLDHAWEIEDRST